MPTCKRAVAPLALVSLVALTLAAPAAPASADRSEPRPAGSASAGLNLGPAGLPEQRQTTALQPGVTVTTVVRGTPDPADVWTVEVAIPSASTDPDAPATALSIRSRAEGQAARLRALGFDARVEQVTTPATVDFAGGTLGWRVRVGRFAAKASADEALAGVTAAGVKGSTVFTGWDGAATDRGPWRVQVLVIDPTTFRGSLEASFGPDIEQRETTSALARSAGAAAGVNAGYFVLDPKSGAPGDPAGIGVYDGKLLSEPVAARPALVVSAAARGTSIQRLRWRGEVVDSRGRRAALDGLNRVPGLIRNCGGTRDDRPTSHALHDFTCMDPDELVAFTGQFGASTPAGPGLEAVLDAAGTVTALRSPRGGPLPVGGASVQATGAYVDPALAAVHVGDRLHLDTTLVDEAGRPVAEAAGTSVVNGAPELVQEGRVHVTVARDGMVHPGDPSFYYGFAAKRNPRTLAGVDARGRTVLVTADGRSTASLGLTLVEAAQLARGLGLVDAMNLDGGGSTTMVVRGQVVNSPSDATGERPVGDALLVLPARP